MSFLWWDQCSYKKTVRSLSPHAPRTGPVSAHREGRCLQVRRHRELNLLVTIILYLLAFRSVGNRCCLSCPVFGILLQQPEETKTCIILCFPILQRYIAFGGNLDYWGIGIFGSSTSMFSHQKSIRNIKMNIDKIWEKFWLSSGQDRLEGDVRSLVYNNVKSL